MGQLKSDWLVMMYAGDCPQLAWCQLVNTSPTFPVSGHLKPQGVSKQCMQPPHILSTASCLSHQWVKNVVYLFSYLCMTCTQTLCVCVCLCVCSALFTTTHNFTECYNGVRHSSGFQGFIDFRKPVCSPRQDAGSIPSSPSQATSHIISQWEWPTDGSQRTSAGSQLRAPRCHEAPPWRGIHLYLVISCRLS